MAVDEAPVIVRALNASDGPAAVALFNSAARWYEEFLAPSELHEPEMTLESWAEEARRMTWYGAFDGIDDDLINTLRPAPGERRPLRPHSSLLPDSQGL